MGDIIVRKCNACKGEIVINRSESNAIYYDNMYYHKDCFHELATKRSQSKRGKPEKWMAALSHIDAIEAETKKMLEGAWIKDDLNTWLLGHYDIAVVPARFWQVLCELEGGVYRGKRCKPVSIETLFGAWKWGQRKLDSISKNNKMNHRGPESDDARIMYDLSILVSKIPNYLTHVSKMKMIESDVNHQKEKTKINYHNIETNSQTREVDDISSLLDEIF